MHGEMGLMARKGRHRKAGYRKPSGDLIETQKTESALLIALRQPHRQLAPPTHADDARAGTPLGCLNLIGAVSHAEYAAAYRFARIVNRYRPVINSPNANPPSIAGAFEPKRGGHEITDAAERTFDYNEALAALNPAGHTSIVIVNQMAVYGEQCPYGGFGALIRGLRRLRDFFDLTDKAKSLQVGN